MSQPIKMHAVPLTQAPDNVVKQLKFGGDGAEVAVEADDDDDSQSTNGSATLSPKPQPRPRVTNK